MTIENLVPILILGIFALYFVIEHLAPGFEQPKVRGWYAKGALFFLLSFALNGAVPALVASLLGPRTLFDSSSLGVAGGALASLLLGDFMAYWIHRTCHRVPAIWRWTHQMHHSAERMDMVGASYSHPLDFIVGVIAPGILANTILGITPTAAAVGGIAGVAIGVFSHMSIKTPRWLGYLIQRPEMHAIHHERGVHAYNYGTFAFTDMLFGTWRNPAGYHHRPLGFYDGASKRVGAMLLGRDIAEPPSAAN